MIDQTIFYTIFAAAVGSGLVAGIFYAFSSFVMGALGRVPPAHGIEAMQAINVVVINRSFMLAFFGTAILCCALLVAAYLRWNEGSGKLLLLGSLFYLVGTIGVTMAFNVPLNTRWRPFSRRRRRPQRYGRIISTGGRCGTRCGRWRRPPP